MSGFIKVSRDIWNVFDGEEFSKREAFLWLVSEACWRDEVRDGVSLKRGQLSHSIRYLAQKWGWLPAKTQRFIAKLRDTPGDTLIETATDTGKMVITLCNYNKILSHSECADTPINTPSDTPSDTNIKKNKEVIDVYNTPLTPQNPDPPPREKIPESEHEQVQKIFSWVERELNSPIPYYSAPINAWISWGADFEADIKPVVRRHKIKYPQSPPRSLTWLDEAIAKSINQRQKPKPEVQTDEKNHGNYRGSDGITAISGGFAGRQNRSGREGRFAAEAVRVATELSQEAFGT